MPRQVRVTKSSSSKGGEYAHTSYILYAQCYKIIQLKNAQTNYIRTELQNHPAPKAVNMHRQVRVTKSKAVNMHRKSVNMALFSSSFKGDEYTEINNDQS